MSQKYKFFLKNSRLNPFIKWAGGKRSELKNIIPELPIDFQNYYEPFVGGGAVYFSINFNKAFINDKSYELINLYNVIKSSSKRNDFIASVTLIMKKWNEIIEILNKSKNDLVFLYENYLYQRINEKDFERKIQFHVLHFKNDYINLFKNILNTNLDDFILSIEKNLIRKFKKLKKNHEINYKNIVENIETALKSSFYTQMRYIYNHINDFSNDIFYAAIFFYIRNFAFGGMFRHNKNGEFNVPYGGRDYNSKNIIKIIDYISSKELHNHLKKTEITNMDFEKFLNNFKPVKNDFIFIDPPYDTEFNTYSQNEFTRSDQIRLSEYLLNNVEAKWMLVIKKTNFIHNLYDKRGINISCFDKKYRISFKNRNNRNTKHLIIKNY